ncbi:hypothetical protein HDU76_001261 [Blyttiomyces sp. JEL0837]|nr:hypothetical protein HDU76_001261 [Blyttiomyces sp. JEL0837]
MGNNQSRGSSRRGSFNPPAKKTYNVADYEDVARIPNQVLFPTENSPPPPYSLEATSRISEIAVRHNINPLFFKRLSILSDFEIVLILDDSGSMCIPTENGATRWTELLEFVRIVLDIATAFDADGLDMFFLNRGSLHGVQTFEQVANAFQRQPTRQDLTPLNGCFASILNQVMARQAQTNNGYSAPPPIQQQHQLKWQFPPSSNVQGRRKTLFLIATDGEPSDSKEGFTQALAYRPNPQSTPVSAPCVDVVDDYMSERNEVLKVQGWDFPFSWGDYVTKTLLGAIDGYFDSMDEARLSAAHRQFAATGRM